MENKYTLRSIEGIQIKMFFGLKMLEAVHDAMKSGKDAEAEHYCDALYGAHRYLDELNEELQEVVAGCIKAGYAERKAKEGAA